MAELIAEYSPPIPAPVRNRKKAKLQKSHENAVRIADADHPTVVHEHEREPALQTRQHLLQREL